MTDVTKFFPFAKQGKEDTTKTKVAAETSQQENIQNTSTSGGNQKPVTEQLLELAMAGNHYFRSPSEEAFVSTGIEGHKETLRVNSSAFREYLRFLYYEKYRKAIAGHVIEETIQLLVAKTRYQGQTHRLHKRVAELNETIYIDLCNKERQVVKITLCGWSVIENPPIHFIRTKSQEALPVPVRGGGIDDLRGFINVRTDDDFSIYLSFLIRALCPRGPYPVLLIKGGQGTAKSTALLVARKLIDPNSTPLRKLPGSDRDMFINAANNWMLVYDNVSSLSESISDALCMISTRGGFSTRILYTDLEEISIDAMQPIALAGITNLAKRGDLVDRSLIINLPQIEQRRSETEFWRAFDKKHASIFGALCDILVCALKNITSVTSNNLPRMADFAQWILAAEEAFPWKKGQFLKAYVNNQKNIMDLALEGDPVALAVLSLMTNTAVWKDTPSETLKVLCQQTAITDKIRNSHSWPGAANKLREHLERAEAFLLDQGIQVNLNIKEMGSKKFMFTKVTAQSPSAEEVETAAPPTTSPDIDDKDTYQSIFPTADSD
ncbi:MAG: hypothetical protein ABSD38_29035 [Syntrophorhabdales bacterium]|jgi:hypothetical protein